VRTAAAGVAVLALFLSIAFPLVLSGVVFVLILFLPLFLIALTGVLRTGDDRSVREQKPSMDGEGWWKHQ
jgi:hypothetical protein